MDSNGNEFFFELSGLRRALIKLDDRIAEMEREDTEAGCHNARFSGANKGVAASNPTNLTAILSGDDLILTSMRAFRESLVSSLRDIYVKFANREFEKLHELHMVSPLGDLADQCAFTLTALLDSIADQHDEQVDRRNSTVQRLLELSDELGFADPADGDQESLAGLAAVRLVDGIGKPNKGIQVGDREVRGVDEKQVETDFVMRVAQEMKGLVDSIALSASERAKEWEIFSVDKDQLYVYSESIRPFIYVSDT
ncbi:hypothetical protein EZE58_09335 [Brevibacterium sp. LS14]|uniref:hypothetical protein n=1 Tax=Brevibacterium TaxID=1696 RepID=UPI0014310167|nr:hypothetical protein [Brevibacterium sp. LS14]NNV08371.1 hypothetical protein [Geobacillus sp. MMMUD3]